METLLQTTLLPLLISPIHVPALLLAWRAHCRTATLTLDQCVATRTSWQARRWWALAPWLLLLLSIPAVAPLMRSDSGLTLLAWYLLPAASFYVAFEPYFFISFSRRKRTNMEPRETRSLPRHKVFLWLNCLLAAFCTNAFQAYTAEFLGPGAIALIGVIPSTLIAAAGLGWLLGETDRKLPAPSTAVASMDPSGLRTNAELPDTPESLSAWERGLRAGAKLDLVLQSKGHVLTLLLTGWMFGHSDLGSYTRGLPALTFGQPDMSSLVSVRIFSGHAFASLVTCGSYGAICLAFARHVLRRAPRPALSYVVWFALLGTAFDIVSTLASMSR